MGIHKGLAISTMLVLILSGYVGNSEPRRDSEEDRKRLNSNRRECGSIHVISGIIFTVAEDAMGACIDIRRHHCVLL